MNLGVCVRACMLSRRAGVGVDTGVDVQLCARVYECCAHAEFKTSVHYGKRHIAYTPKTGTVSCAIVSETRRLSYGRVRETYQARPPRSDETLVPEIIPDDSAEEPVRCVVLRRGEEGIEGQICAHCN